MIAACPHCREMVLVPETVDGGIRVACPLCQAEYELQELLATLPPKLVVLEPPSFAAMASVDTESSPPFDFDSEPAAPSHSGASSVRSTVAFRPKSGNRSFAVEFLKIVMGGVVGLVIAQAILWWLPPDWRRDPIQLAPRLPASLAFLAPRELRQVGTASRGAGDGEANADSGEPVEPPRFNVDGAYNELQEKVARSVDDPVFVDRADGEDSQASRVGPETPLGGLPSAANGAVETDSHGATRAGEFDLLESAVDTSDGMAPEYAELSVDDMIGVRDAPVFSAEQIFEAINSVRAASQQWDSVQDSEPSMRQTSAIQLFESLYNLAWKATFLDANDQRLSATRDALDQLLLEMGKQPDKVSLVGKAAASWLGSKNRSSDGVVLAGTIQSIAPEGLFYEVRLELFANNKPLVTAVCPVDPSHHPQVPLQVGYNVFLVGGIMDDPPLDITGYQGREASVVWTGRWVVLPN